MINPVHIGFKQYQQQTGKSAYHYDRLAAKTVIRWALNRCSTPQDMIKSVVLQLKQLSELNQYEVDSLFYENYANSEESDKDMVISCCMIIVHDHDSMELMSKMT